MDAYLERQICQRIKQARKGAGLTQQEMADLLDLTLRGYQNYEKARAPFRRLDDIARLTGVSQEWLLHGEPKAQPQGDLQAELSANVAELTTAMAEALRRLERILGLLERGEGSHIDHRT